MSDSLDTIDEATGLPDFLLCTKKPSSVVAEPVTEAAAETEPPTATPEPPATESIVEMLPAEPFGAWLDERGLETKPKCRPRQAKGERADHGQATLALQTIPGDRGPGLRRARSIDQREWPARADCAARRRHSRWPQSICSMPQELEPLRYGALWMMR
jgi:hypothetical protein